jgi:hypothetical protein
MINPSEELIEAAYVHTMSELGLESIKPSLNIEFASIQKAHNAIHECLYLPALLSPSPSNDQPTWNWQSKSAFLLYQWELFHCAHRSLIAALCAYYNSAFAMLRVVLEILISGSFWECISHKQFRDKTPILDGTGSDVKDWLHIIFRETPHIEDELETISATIYDQIGSKIQDHKFRPSVRTMLRQLDDWDMFASIPNPEESIYKGIYGQLSSAVHVSPDNVDIGRRLFAGFEIFEQLIIPEALHQYIALLHQLMDISILVELNVMRSVLERYQEARNNLNRRLSTLESLELQHSLTRAKELLELTG